jgi:hypothetical protein
MIRKEITYTDFNDEVQTEACYFNLSKAELIEMEVADGGSLGDELKKYVMEQNISAMLKMFKTIILESYGVKSEDGKRFIKDRVKTEEFKQSPAFDALFTELATEPDAAAEFVNGVVPKDLVEKALKHQSEVVPINSGPGYLSDPKTGKKLPWADREPTAKELQSMTQAQLLEVYRRKSAQ